VRGSRAIQLRSLLRGPIPHREPCMRVLRAMPPRRPTEVGLRACHPVVLIAATRPRAPPIWGEGRAVVELGERRRRLGAPSTPAAVAFHEAEGVVAAGVGEPLDGVSMFFVQGGAVNGGYSGALTDPLVFEPSAP
jgi:hypothetical protein